MEAGYKEKVDELCQRYSLEGFVKSLGMNNPHIRIYVIVLMHFNFSLEYEALL